MPPSRRGVEAVARRPTRRHVTGAYYWYGLYNYFYSIDDWRRIATRYEKFARNFLAATLIVGALSWNRL
jgi:hypothetical protein